MGFVEVSEEQLLDFAGPMLGFDAYRRYALIAAPDAPPFHWLQCLEARELAFPVVSAHELSVSYRTDSETARKLDVTGEDDVDFWIIVTIPSDGGQMRLNLRAPIAVNRRTRAAAQIVTREEYPIGCAVAASRTG
jgi:flagellar assembly factor FliW